MGHITVNKIAEAAEVTNGYARLRARELAVALFGVTLEEIRNDPDLRAYLRQWFKTV